MRRLLLNFGNPEGSHIAYYSVESRNHLDGIHMLGVCKGTSTGPFPEHTLLIARVGGNTKQRAGTPQLEHTLAILITGKCASGVFGLNASAVS